MEFTATEAGFENGMGGASSAARPAGYHYVLFGWQTDEQHPECDGAYFEFDNQIHGSVGSVSRVVVADNYVKFELHNGQPVVVGRGVTEEQWTELVRGIREVFGHEIITDA